MSYDQFRRAEDQYFLLKGQFASGRITQEQFDAALKQLMVQDAQGRWWMIGAESGKWYVSDGQSWVEAQPSGLALSKVEGAGAGIPTAPPAAQAQRRGVNLLPIVAIGVIVVLCLCGVVGLLFAANQGILKINLGGPTSPPTVAPASTTLARATPTTIPSVTPAATVTPTLSTTDLITRADALTFQSKFADAAALYERAIQLDPSNAITYARWARMINFQAYLEWRDELWQSAVGKAETAAQLAPTNPEVFVWLARAYDWNADYDKALTAAQKAVQLAPASAEAHTVLAEVNLDKQKLADAETAAQKAVQLNPNSAEAHRILGYVLNGKNQSQAALGEFEKAAQIEPNLAVRHTELAMFYASAKDYVKAGAAFQQALALYPQAAVAYYGWGRSFYDQKQYDPAIENLTRATQINVRYTRAYHNLGLAYYAADKCPQAIPAFQKTIELNPQANLAMTYLGWCYYKTGNLAAANDWAKKAAALDPNYADTKALLATLATALATPTPTIPPGLYVTNLRLEPASPKRGQDIGFYVTFLNAASGDQNYRWLVYIYRQENLRNSFGETASIVTSIPVGRVEQKALSTWKLTGGGECENFVARVAWLDENRRATPFNKPDGQMYELGFAVCP